MSIKSIIIVGGGPSILDGLALNLKDKIKNKCVLLCNYAYETLEGSALCFVDASNSEKCFYNVNKNFIKSFPVSFGIDKNLDIPKPTDKTFWIKNSEKYLGWRNFKNGAYCAELTGYFALSIACWLLEGIGNVYLCGFDWTQRTESDKQKGVSDNPHAINAPLELRAKTHYYPKYHRGVGFTEYYETHNPNDKFAPFLEEKNIKIYNVSPNSNITCFEKINYKQFFNLLEPSNYKQYQIRNYIKWRWNDVISN